jgi:DNA helicase-2/ATP-dependent DNA helicase PcrA
MNTVPPRLEGDALRAVRHRGSPMQIIAAAGSGKTEVVSQRVAALIESGVDPQTIVAFTFTERAAKELKRRTELRVAARLGQAAVDQLNGCHIGTLHAYCYALLRRHVAKYETYDLLDDNRLAAFLVRERERIQLETLGGKLYDGVRDFIRNAQVVENERIPLERLAPPFRDLMARYLSRLEVYRLFTFGRLICLAVDALDDPAVAGAVRSTLRHLIVDEYQDINPAQESLIAKLAGPAVELCVVGDDDQSIYQWRGSDVNNIVRFERRYRRVATFELLINRRSRPEIIQAANGFAQTIQGRLRKTMLQYREAARPEIVTWRARTEADEAECIARAIKELIVNGYRYRDIGILVRSAASYSHLLEAFQKYDIPVQPGGRTGLFKVGDAQLFGKTFAYLAGQLWRPVGYGPGDPVSLEALCGEYAERFDLSRARVARIRKRLEAWKNEVETPTRPADLIGAYYDLLNDCGVADWDLTDRGKLTRLGNQARCSAILADHESVRRRARPDDKVPGQITGGEDRGKSYYFWLAMHIQNWAQGRFEGFEGEDDLTLDAVDLTTVHRAKGLEWPVVFVPCVSANRFPPSKTGKAQTWAVPEETFEPRRYEGCENDERRLFYVAVTRARDWLSVSTHDTPNKRSVRPSKFLLEFAASEPEHLDHLPLPRAVAPDDAADDTLAITFSELASYATCALAYRLRSLIGFQPSLAPELGYGKAVHHIMRRVAEFTRQRQVMPSPTQLQLIFDEEFYLPAANKTSHAVMRASALKLVENYFNHYSADLARVWALERPFTLHLQNAVLTGRADVILQAEAAGAPASLVIVDYKTAVDDSREADYDWQLQVYADAGRREGLDVRAAYVHELKSGQRRPVDIGTAALKGAETKVISLVDRLKARQFDPSPGRVCRECDVKPLCKYGGRSSRDQRGGVATVLNRQSRVRKGESDRR